MNSKPIHFSRLDAPSPDRPAEPEEHAGLSRHFQALRASMDAAWRLHQGAAPVAGELQSLLDLVGDFLDYMRKADLEVGPDGTLVQLDADLAAADAQRALASLTGWLQRLAPADAPDTQRTLDTLVIGAALWTMRHGLPLQVPEPLINALARRSNDAQTRQDVAAVYALMQGTVEHLKPQLGADLEQSNPERPWRILHLNFALTGIRSADRLLASHAFSAFNAGLPLERRAFYEALLEQAQQSGLPQEMTDLIGTELAAVARPH